jgi:glycosyltransferase involved in cell wall biosynthesis
MRIAVDGRVTLRYPGLGRVCVNVVRELAAIDTENTYTVFALDDQFDFLAGTPNFDVVRVRESVLSAATLYTFHRHVRACRADLYFSTFQVTPLYLPCPMVVMIQDMMDLMYKDAFAHHRLPAAWALRAFFRIAVPATVRRAAQLVTTSQSTKGHLCEYFGIAPQRVVCIPLGVSEHFRPVLDPARLAEVRRRHNLPERFVFYLGSGKPYKNLTGMLAAFAKLCTSTDDDDLVLVIAGLKHFASSRLPEQIERMGLSDRVRPIGYVPDADLPAVYSACRVFVFASIWEGFGLPPLEAMACGAPVVTSDRTSLPEVVGDAGLTADPEDPDALAEAIGRVWSDDGLRRTLSQRGRDRARQFPWRRTAEGILDLFECLRA